MPELENALHMCSWCRKDENHLEYLVVDADSNNICNECVAILIKIDTEFWEKKKKCGE